MKRSNQSNAESRLKNLCEESQRLEARELKKAMRDAKNSFAKMKRVQELLCQAYADISKDIDR